jgi:adenosylhomocysteine nucleosidase
MKILVTFALETEFAPLRKLGGFRRVPGNAWDKTYKARVGGADVRVVLTGVGRFAAERAAARAFVEHTDLCIVSGLAGGLKPQYALSDVLVATEVTDPARLRVLRSDGELVESAVEFGGRRAETFITAPKVVSNADEKRELGANGDAVDMESLYLMSAAPRHHVRAVAIRAISDTADSDLPLEFNRVFTETGDVSLGKVVRQVAAHPQRLPALLRLAHESQRAAARLAEFLMRYIQSLESAPPREVAKADAIAI